MKKRILFAISTLLVLGLAIAAFALSGTNTKTSVKDCCANCGAKSGDSCPMKKGENASATDKASCCDKDDCCCKGDACPMKKGENGAGHDNCPMMKKDKETAAKSTEMKNVVVVSDAEDCCANGSSACCKGGSSDCCKGKHG